MMCMNNVVIVAVEIHQNLKWLKKNQDDDDLDLEDLIIQFDEDVNLDGDDDEKNSQVFFRNSVKEIRKHDIHIDSMMMMIIITIVNVCENFFFQN